MSKRMWIGLIALVICEVIGQWLIDLMSREVFAALAAIIMAPLAVRDLRHAKATAVSHGQ